MIRCKYLPLSSVYWGEEPPMQEVELPHSLHLPLPGQAIHS